MAAFVGTDATEDAFGFEVLYVFGDTSFVHFQLVGDFFDGDGWILTD